ncbi:hypothetical protein [Burkholderia phage vB_BglM_WTB]
MNSIAQIQEAKTSELVAFWNANCEKVGKPAVKKFTNKETAVKRCTELLEALGNADAPADLLAPVEPVAEEVAPTEPVTVEEGVVEDEEDGASIPAAPFNIMQSVMSALQGQTKAPTSLESLPATRHELSDETADEKIPAAPRRQASNSSGVASSWAVPEVREARLTRNGVRVTSPEGVTMEHKSVNEAFRFYRLPSSKHIRFRGMLKAAPNKTLDFEGYTFQVI